MRIAVSLLHLTRPAVAARALLVTLLVALLLVCVTGSAAHAEGTDFERPALKALRAHLLQDGSDTLEPRLLEALVDTVPDDATLLALSYLAQETASPNALAECRAQASERTGADEPSPEVRLALGYASLGMAQHYAANQIQGSSIPLLFAQATAQADALTREEDANIASAAALLAARSLASQGLVADAVAGLEGTAAHREGRASATWGAILRGTEGSLRYGQGAEPPVGADGRPVPAAVAHLTRAYTFLDEALATPALAIRPTRRGDWLAQRAWSAHRLGWQPQATAAYATLYAQGASGVLYALRGLASLYAYEGDKHREALRALADATGQRGGPALDALIELDLTAGQRVGALDHAERRRALDPTQAIGWSSLGRVFAAMEQTHEATRHLLAALDRDPKHTPAVVALDALARAALPNDALRAVAIYEQLIERSPKDPYLRNNLGFVLRELVSPHTTLDESTGLQRLKPDAPAEARAFLDRCVAAYASAVALIDPDDDGLREIEEDWALASVVNDYGLMLHYFVDVQDPARAEVQYLRALAMTDHAYQDSYAPNLQRLYRDVLEGHELAWYRAALAAKETIQRTATGEDGTTELVPDEAKRASAAADAVRLRARILQELGIDDKAAGSSGPSDGAPGTGG